MGGICSGVEQGQRPLEEVAVTVKRKEIGNVVASIGLFHSHHDHVTDDAVGVTQVGIFVLILLLD